MSLSKLNYTLSNINAILGSSVNYIYDKQQGDKSGAAEVNFGLNVVNGLARNQIAEGIRRNTGSYLGYTVNNLAGYGDATANAQGMAGLMGVSIMSNPFIFGGGCYPATYCQPMLPPPMPMYGGGYYGGGMCPTMFGGTFFDVNGPFGRGGCYC